MALSGVAQIYLCFCAQETARLKRATSLLLVCQRALLHSEGRGDPLDLWGDVAQWGNLCKRGSSGKHHVGLEGVAWVLRAEETPHSHRGASVVLKRPWDCPLPLQPPILHHTLLGPSAESGVHIRLGFPHGEETEGLYIKNEHIRGEEQEDLMFMPPGRANR